MALDVKEVERLARGYVEYAAASGDVYIELESVAYEIYDIRDGHCP